MGRTPNDCVLRRTPLLTDQQLHDLYPRADRHRLSPVSNRLGCQWEVFVDGRRGFDGNSGSISSPVRSIHRALSLSRAVPRMATPQSRTACITTKPTLDEDRAARKRCSLVITASRDSRRSRDIAI